MGARRPRRTAIHRDRHRREHTHSATIVIDDPAVRAKCSGDKLQVGSTIAATLTTADVAARKVEFAVVGP
ncbi:MAG TPA: hypothetical protein VGL26_08030 [Jatrophihabitans sp.]|jgi:hypothetical protein